MTVRNGPLFLSLLLGIAGLVVWFCLDGEDGDRKACSSVSAAILASNPNLERSLQIEEAKKRCIRDRICDREVWILSGPCEFGAYELGECRDLDPALAEFKIAQRHLEGGVRTCELNERTNRFSQTVYQWPGSRSTGRR